MREGRRGKAEGKEARGEGCAGREVVVVVVVVDEPMACAGAAACSSLNARGRLPAPLPLAATHPLFQQHHVPSQYTHLLQASCARAQRLCHARR